MKKCWLTAVLLLTTCLVMAQSPAVIDSLKLKFSKAKTSEEKVETASVLCRVLMNVNMAEADKYGKIMSEEAELSRDRKLMVKALIIHGERYAYYAGKKEYLEKSSDYFNKALQLSKENKLDKETTRALLGLSNNNIYLSNTDKALNYTTQAFAIATALKDDSLQVEVYNSFGSVYQVKKDRLLALRNFLNGLRIAEELKPTKQQEAWDTKNDLLRKSYRNLSGFYADIKEYDKAIDYATKAMDKLNMTKGNGGKYNKAIDLNYIGNLYAMKKNFDMSVFYYEQSIKLADSLKFNQLKVPAYNSILNQYLQSDEPQKALDYFNKATELKAYIINFGFPHVIDQAYAVIYTGLGQFDSARYYFAKAAPLFETSATESNKIAFYSQYGKFYYKSGDMKNAVLYYEKAKALADKTASLEWQEELAKYLDTAYGKNNDLKQSYYYNSLYHQYKDSLQKLGEEKDLMQMELADEQQRQERIAEEERQALDKKHNLQYTGIAIAIATVFLLLVLLGIFHVSESMIRIMGFFAFIFLFEFIILLADHRIHEWTHGEPLPVLGIKIILIAMLLPLHHWLEHKVVHYLASRRLIIPKGKGVWTAILPKRKTLNH
ncbi:MAG TPA: tetratricopeptide repeat protein [Flavisolibacter sp.]|jgi:tetratricopeptide (TPR) repeat protein|nr:tetratricopeptide repeat protein [Flavisolibacter sp.]